MGRSPDKSVSKLHWLVPSTHKNIVYYIGSPVQRSSNCRYHYKQQRRTPELFSLPSGRFRHTLAVSSEEIETGFTQKMFYVFQLCI